MNTINLIIALASGLLGSIIGGIIASCGAIRAVTRMECMRQSERLKILLRSVISELNSIEGHPASVVENADIDNAVCDVKPLLGCRRRRAFSKAWNQYRYDPQHDNYAPSEYTEISTVDAKKLISSRIHNLISLLN